MIQIKEWRPKDWLDWNQAWSQAGRPEDEGSEGDYERGADQMYRAILMELLKRNISLPELLERKVD